MPYYLWVKKVKKKSGVTGFEPPAEQYKDAIDRFSNQMRYVPWYIYLLIRLAHLKVNGFLGFIKK